MKPYKLTEFELRPNIKELFPSSPLSNFQKEKLQRGSAIYIYHGPKHTYIGQTKHFLNSTGNQGRHYEHWNENNGDNNYRKGKYSKVIVAFGSLITQESLDDIEKKLIAYFKADNEKNRVSVDFDKSQIDNNTNGNEVYHRYLTEDKVNSDFLIPFWHDLYNKKYVNQPNLTSLRNSILFKYSPFFSLSSDQLNVLNKITKSTSNNIVYGMAGTGKTVVVTNLAARLSRQHPNATIAVVGKSNWIAAGKEIFNDYNVKNITVNTAYQLIKSNRHFDYIIVDEAHRLRHYYSKGNHVTLDIFKDNNGNYSDIKTELDCLLSLSNQLTLFYDPSQVIRPSDIPRYRFKKIIGNDFKRFDLTNEYRISINSKSSEYDGNDFISGILSVLQLNKLEFNKDLFSAYRKDATEDTYFGIVNSINSLFEYLDYMENFEPSTRNTNRVIAGYSRPWISHKDKSAFDWTENENESKWKWNSTNENWLSKANSREEIGSIHAVQGIDLSYVGVIISKDISIDTKGKIVGNLKYYKDKNGTPTKKDLSNPKYVESFNDYIKDIYYVLLTRGVKGIRVFFEDKIFEQYFKNFMNIK